MCLFFSPVRSIFVLIFNVVCSGISTVLQDGDLTIEANRGASSCPWPNELIVHVEPSVPRISGCTAPKQNVAANDSRTASTFIVDCTAAVYRSPTDRQIELRQFVGAILKCETYSTTVGSTWPISCIFRNERHRVECAGSDIL